VDVHFWGKLKSSTDSKKAFLEFTFSGFIFITMKFLVRSVPIFLVRSAPMISLDSFDLQKSFSTLD
jgi:hypothetical protein